jgi:hemerythrin-like domain-containing protein
MAKNGEPKRKTPEPSKIAEKILSMENEIGELHELLRKFERRMDLLHMCSSGIFSAVHRSEDHAKFFFEKLKDKLEDIESRLFPTYSPSKDVANNVEDPTKDLEE